MDAIGLRDFRPWDRLDRADASVSAESAPSSASKAPLLGVLRDCCVALQRPPGEADRVFSRLQVEWLERPSQLQRLAPEGWQRLSLPVGLEAELKRRLRMSTPVRPKTPKTPARPGTAPTPARNKPRPADSPMQCPLRAVLRAHCGESWAAQLLAQLGLQRQNSVDANSLQSALRSLGVPSFSSAQVARAIRGAKAAEGGELRGPASAEATVCAIHGPLRGERARAVDDVFFELGGDIHGTLTRQTLKRRIAALELPAVKAGNSAEEALRNFTRRWGFKQEVDRASFSDAHILLSALFRGEDVAFQQLLRRLWRLSGKPSEEVHDSVPRLVSREREARPSPARLQRTLEPERSSRATVIEDSIQSSRATDLLQRLRQALRSRGPEAVQLLVRRFQGVKAQLGVKELRRALAEVGVGCSEEDVAELLRGMDVDHTGAVDLEVWLRVLRGPLSPNRAALVREAFASLRGKDGFIDAQTLRARFDASKHPEVEAGRRSEKEVFLEVMAQLSRHGSKISLSDFAKYYENISAGIQDDQYFGHILRRSWGLAASAGNIMARNAHRMYEGHIRSTEGGLCGL